MKLLYAYFEEGNIIIYTKDIQVIRMIHHKQIESNSAFYVCKIKCKKLRKDIICSYSL
jgi:hypothetical protein